MTRSGAIGGSSASAAIDGSATPDNTPTPRYGTIVKHLKNRIETAAELAAKLPDETLHHLAAAISDEARNRAIDQGDEEAVIADGFETGFAHNGLAVLPWISEPYIVAPGGLVGKNRGSHKCRFVSVNDTWVWDCAELINEEKRSSPGTNEGFRAVALLPIIEGMELDVVQGKNRSGQHSVDLVISFEVRRGELVEVSQRTVAPAGMR